MADEQTQKPRIQVNKPQTREDEYELVPLTPIRRIEKRIEQIEHAGVPIEAVHELVSAVRTNQQVVEEAIKLNNDMIRRVSELTSGISEMTTRVNDLVSRMQLNETPKETGQTKELELKFNERLEKLEKRLNALIITTMPRRPRPMQMPIPMQQM